MWNSELSALTIRGRQKGEGEAVCCGEVPVACQTHPLARPNVACDTSHPITPPYR